MVGFDNSDKRSHILDAASELMMEKGVKETSLTDIARKASMSKGTLYYYYQTKGDLVYDVTEKHFERVTRNLINWLNGAEGKSYQEILRVVFTTILGAETRTKLHLYLLQEAVLENEALHQRFQATYREWRALIREQLERLLQNHDRAENMSFLILAALDGFVIQTVVNGEQIPLDTILEDLARLM